MDSKQKPIPLSPLFDRKPNLQTQPPANGSGIGFFQEKRGIGPWPTVTDSTLSSDQALIRLYQWYAERGLIPGGDAGLELVFLVAQNALEKGKTNKPGLFVRRIRDWGTRKLHPIGESVADRAHARFKNAMGYGTPRKRDWLEDFLR